MGSTRASRAPDGDESSARPANGRWFDETLSYHAETATDSPATQVELPSSLGRFTEVRPCARGVRWTDYNADDDVLGRSVTLTVPVPMPSPLEPFLNRARQFIGLDHSGIHEVRDVLSIEGIGLIVTDAIEHRRLSEVLAERRFDWFDAARLIAAAAEAVAHAHARGLVHGNLSLDHILLNAQGQLIVSGWGLSPVIGGEIPPQDRPWHCAPEQLVAGARQVDAAADVYGLSAILYTMLCGREPFRATAAAELQRQILEDVPQPPRQLVHNIPVALEQICLQGLAKDPQRRTGSAESLARELARVADSVEESTLVHARGRTAARGGLDHEAQHSQDWLIIHWAAAGSDSPSSIRSSVEKVVMESWAGSGLNPQRSGEGRLMVRLSRREREESAVEATVALRGVPMLSQLAGAIDCTDAELCLRIETAQAQAGTGKESPDLGVLTHRRTRIEARIRRTEITLSERSAELVNRYFACVREGRDRLTVSIGDGSIPLRLDPPRSTPAFSGRDSQLEILKARWHQACEGLGQTVMLIGAEGMGKTRLIESLKAWIVETSAGQVEVVVWRCLPRYRGATFQPAADAFHARLGLQSAPDAAAERRLVAENLHAAGLDLGDCAPVFSMLLDLDDESGMSSAQFRTRGCECFQQWLRAVARTVPVLFVVEDLQWSDAATLDLLGEWIDEGLHDRILTVTTLRPEFETPWGSRPNQLQVALNRLTRRQVESMLTTAFDRAPDAGTVEKVAEQTGRIPQFIEDYVERMLRSGELDRAAGTAAEMANQ